MRQEESKADKKAVRTAERQMVHIQREMEKQTKQAHQCKIELQSKLEKQHEEVRTTHHQREHEFAAVETQASALKRKLAAVQSEALAVQNKASAQNSALSEKIELAEARISQLEGQHLAGCSSEELDALRCTDDIEPWCT